MPPISLTEVFDRFADGVYTLAVRLLRDHHLAEDVVADTFLAILRGRAPYRGDGSLAGWVYRIGYRRAIALLRRRRELPTADAELLPLADRPAEAVHAEVIRRELADRLDAAIGELPPTLRAAFVLRDVNELSTAEVSAALGIGESAVKMRLARARARLRVSLKEYLRESHL
ncbi:MAG: RNA polymerase sigma factor [Actinobacteria bacterium]|nr:RNA polymerase sigma factor [Actinomycetota bacterium]